MSAQNHNIYPKLHNAMWPGLVGKGSPGAEPCIDLETMLDLTARAEVNGLKFDGVDLFLFEPHVSIDIDDDGLKRLADKIRSKGFVVGSVVAPVWPPTGGGSGMGGQEDRKRFLEQVRKACRIAKGLRDIGARPYGVVRIDSACGVTDWAPAAEENQTKIAQTFSEACDVAESFGELIAAEGEICWGGMHSWKKMLDLLQRVNRPKTLGFQADMAHTLLYILGYNAPEDAILPPDWDWSDPSRLDHAMKTLTDALRPWTVDFHVAQNDATVKGSGTHDKTGHHCLPNDPNGKLNIPHHAGFWLRDEQGQPTKAFRHICWDGCMFPNAVMMEPQTWNAILSTLLAVRDAHGWSDTPPEPLQAPAQSQEGSGPAIIKSRPRKSVQRIPKRTLSKPPRRPQTTKPTIKLSRRKASRKPKTLKAKRARTKAFKTTASNRHSRPKRPPAKKTRKGKRR